MTKDQRRRAGLCPRRDHGPAVAFGLCLCCALRHARHHGRALAAEVVAR
jgi:hypothetical protein